MMNTLAMCNLILIQQLDPSTPDRHRPKAGLHIILQAVCARALAEENKEAEFKKSHCH